MTLREEGQVELRGRRLTNLTHAHLAPFPSAWSRQILHGFLGAILYTSARCEVAAFDSKQNAPRRRYALIVELEVTKLLLTLKNEKASIKQQRIEHGMEAKFSKLLSKDLPKGSGL